MTQDQRNSTLHQIETIHTSLGGLALMCLILAAGLILPLFGFNELSSPYVAGTILVTVAIGIAGLYKLNLHAHKIVRAQARLADVLINSSGQGFLTFDAQGRCGHVYSQASLSLLQTGDISDRPITDILRVPENKHKEFQEWLDILFMPGHALSFEDAARFLPDAVNRDDGCSISLAYRPVRMPDGSLTRIVVIATDHTEEKEAQKRADQERQFAAMICAIFAERQSFVLTMQQAGDILDQLSRCEANLFSADFFREVHTIKGAALHFKMEGLGAALHTLEQKLRDSKTLPQAEVRDVLGDVRAEVQREFGRIQNSLRDILGSDDSRPHGLIEIDEESIYDFGQLLKKQNVSPDIYYAYQSSILSVPLFSLLKSLDRQMLPLAERLEKRVKPIRFTGDAVRVPSRPMQHLLLALTHVVHNIVDHGIEAPITRMAKGKDPQGEVNIHVRHTGDEHGAKWIEIAIRDDGAGIDPNRVRQKLNDSDPLGGWRHEDDHAVIQNLLTHDISTRDETTLLSGRGAGMGAVYQEVVKLNGRVTLNSEMHKGTELVILLPDRLETGPA